MKNFISAIEKQLRQEQQELDSAQDITTIVFPIINNLKKENILHPIMLKTKLAKLPDEYRDATYGLCRIATDGGPEGSFIVLDPEKVLSLLDEIDFDEPYNANFSKKRKAGGKFIFGLTTKVAKAIKNLVYGKLAALCHLVNDLVLTKIINTPSIGMLKTASIKCAPLKKSTKSRG